MASAGSVDADTDNEKKSVKQNFSITQARNAWIRNFFVLKFILLFAITTANSQEISSSDSSKLLNTWTKTAQLLKTSDIAALKRVCMDSILCGWICGSRLDTIDQAMSFGKFVESGLPAYNEDKKLAHIISTTKPSIFIGGYSVGPLGKEWLYTVAYTYYKANELAKYHEGMQVTFNFIIRKGEFKLAHIMTVP
jgi:hypothetical protein